MKNILKEKYLKNFKSIMSEPAIRILPSALAYYLFISIIPILTLIAVFCSQFRVSATDLSNVFSVILPAPVEDILTTIFNSIDKNSVSVLFIIIGFILASNGADAIILASNTLYKFKNKGFLERRIKSMFLTILLILLTVFILFVLAFGNIIVKFILGLKIFASISSTMYWLFLILKWPLAIIIIYIILKIIFTIAPNEKIKSKYVSTGAMFSTIGLIISSILFSFYANNIARYDIIYGNLANIIVVLIFFYLISYFIVIGISINANNYEMEKEK